MIGEALFLGHDEDRRGFEKILVLYPVTDRILPSLIFSKKRPDHPFSFERGSSAAKISYEFPTFQRDACRIVFRTFEADVIPPSRSKGSKTGTSAFPAETPVRRQKTMTATFPAEIGSQKRRGRPVRGGGFRSFGSRLPGRFAPSGPRPITKNREPRILSSPRNPRRT